MKFKSADVSSFLIAFSAVGVTCYLSIRILCFFSVDIARYIVDQEISANVIKDVDSTGIVILKGLAIIFVFLGAYFLNKYFLNYLKIKDSIYVYFLPLIVLIAYYMGWDLINDAFKELSLMANKYYVYYHYDFFQEGTTASNLIYKSSNTLKLISYYSILSLYSGLICLTYTSFFFKEMLVTSNIKLNSSILNSALCVFITAFFFFSFHQTVLAGRRYSDLNHYAKFIPSELKSTYANFTPSQFSTGKNELNEDDSVAEIPAVDKPRMDPLPAKKECSGPGNEGCITKVRRIFAQTGKNILAEKYLGEGKFGIAFMDSQHPGAYDAIVSTDCNCEIVDESIQNLQ